MCTSGVHWKNGTLINSPAANVITAIAFNGADMHILGVDANNNNVVWKNGAAFATLGSISSQIVTCMAIGN